MQRSFYSLALLLLCLLAGSQALQAQTPLAFNDKLVSITDSLYARGQEWGLQFNAAYKENDFTRLMPYRVRLERFIDNKIAEVRVMKDVKDSKPLREAMLDFLVFEKGMITKAFKPIEALGKGAKPEAIKAAYDQLTLYTGEEGVALQKVSAAQEAYAKSNGFTIEAPAPETPEEQ